MRLETQPLPPQIQCPRSLPALPAARRAGGIRNSRPLASILGEFALIKSRIFSHQHLQAAKSARPQVRSLTCAR
jgi:hypothetical protein